MAKVTKGYTFGATELVTNTKLHTFVDSATVTQIVNADLSSNAAIVDTKLSTISTANKVAGTALFNLSGIPEAAGMIPQSAVPTIEYENKVAGTSFSNLAGIPSTAGFIPSENLSQVSGITFFNLSGIPSSAGKIPTANLSAVNAADLYNLSGLPAGFIPSSNLSQVSGVTFFNLSGIQSTAGFIPSANLSQVSGTTFFNLSGTPTSAGMLPDANLKTKRIVILKCTGDTTALVSGNGLAYLSIPHELSGMNLIACGTHIYATSNAGLVEVMIRNVTDAQDMLSTPIYIDTGEYDSHYALTAPVIDTTKDDVNTGDTIAVDVDHMADTNVKGLDVRFTFQTP